LHLLGIVVGITIAIGLLALGWRSLRTASPVRRALELVLVAVVSVAGGAAAHFGSTFIDEPATANGSVKRPDSLDPDRALADLRQAPLVRLVLTDVPDAEAKIRAAMEEDRREPVTSGTTRAFAVMNALRQVQIVPALRAADDATARGAVAARLAMLAHLKATNVPLCRQFALVGLQRVDLLDTKGQELFRDTLAALETAYKSGRDAKLVSKPFLTDNDARFLMADAGLTAVDFGKLSTLAEQPEGEACDYANRLNAMPDKVAADKAGPLARYLLTNQ
jgi:hypothetical protein